jgi:hypothetical protein
MSLTTRQAFDQFLEDISITEHQKTVIVKGRTDSVVENLTAAFPVGSDLPFLSARLMGSAAKGTITRPIDDIDVLAIFSNEGNAWQNKYRYDSKAFLYRVRRAYDGFSVAQVGARGQAVRVFFKTGGHVDVAPVFKQNDDDFHLPAGDGSWITTSPFVANKWFAAQNANLDYHLSPLVRMLKKWNKAHSKRLQSFHLETIAGNAFASLSGNHRVATQKFFEWGGSHIDVLDPGGKSGLLSYYLGYDARLEVVKAFNSASNRASLALAAEGVGDHEEAKRLWQLVFGSKFPT